MTALAKFCSTLRAERLQRHLPQGLVALHLGIAQTTLIGWEKGRRAPSSRAQLAEWAALLGAEVPDDINVWRPALAPCGTPSAHRRHVTNLEPVDAACQAAHTAAMRTWRATRKEVA